MALPDIFCLASGALKQARTIVECLEVHPEAMTRTLQLTHRLTQTEAVMMALAPHIGRQRAHDLVYAASRAAITGQRPVLDVLAQDPEVSKHLDRAALAKLLDPRHYLGPSVTMAGRVLAHGTRHNRDHGAAADPAGRHSTPASAAESPEQSPHPGPMTLRRAEPDS